MRRPSQDELFLAAVHLADERASLERELVAAILARPSDLLNVARQQSIEPGDFHCADIRLVFCAAAVAHDRSRDYILQLARRALQDEGYWDATAPAWFKGPLHSDATLIALANAYPPSAVTVRDLSRRLIRVSRRQHLANQYIARAMRLLSDPDALDQIQPAGCITSRILPARRAS